MDKKLYKLLAKKFIKNHIAIKVLNDNNRIYRIYLFSKFGIIELYETGITTSVIYPSKKPVKLSLKELENKIGYYFGQFQGDLLKTLTDKDLKELNK